jgi:hypothetical protein
MLNYNVFLDRLQKYGLLTSAWSGIEFKELPLDIQREIELCVTELRHDFEHEDLGS